MNEKIPDSFVAFAQRMADAAGEVVRRHFRTPLAIDDKADRSPVTIADREIEALLRRMIGKTFPDHGIIGEELGNENALAEWVWVLDPIDGTKAFITGKPSFGTLIGLAYGGRPVLGLVDQAITGERWTGGVGWPTVLNDKPVHVRTCPDLATAALYATDPDMFDGDATAAFGRLERRVKLRRFGADCYAYAMLASGWVDLVCECQLKVYDHVAVVAMIEAAGGIVTDWDGVSPGLRSNVCVLAAGDRLAHAQALDVLKG
ncbi:MAG: histidinol-phosphatase [Alphaproteobacteria bacterium]|nr:histidinol-phosphatase [Alphaproteobacteria bacterium]